jgi:hypothetical protein
VTIRFDSKSVRAMLAKRRTVALGSELVIKLVSLEGVLDSITVDGNGEGVVD